MPFVRVGDITLHYVLEGPAGAPVVMFSNSLGTNLDMWEAQAAALRGQYQVLRYDTRGHGLSDAPPGDYTMDMLADDAAALAKALGISRFHFCGISLGGMAGQRLAAKAPGLVASLMLCDTAATMVTSVWDERIAAIRKAGTIDVTTAGTMERWFTKAFRDREGAALAGISNMYRRTPFDGYLGCATAIRNMDLREGGAKIACPTLIVVGEEDPSTPVASAEALNKSIKGSTLKVIPQAAHISPIEQASAVTRAIGDFLAAQKG